MTLKTRNPRTAVAMNAEESKARSSSEHCLKLPEDALTWREVDGEIVVLDRRSWTYLGVNGAGMLLWTQIVKGTTRSGLVECLRDAYDLDTSVAKHDVEAFLETLSLHNLLVERGV
jgi:Coenzyme PQQ synthesis protein D (PqqD)